MSRLANALRALFVISILVAVAVGCNIPESRGKKTKTKTVPVAGQIGALRTVLSVGTKGSTGVQTQAKSKAWQTLTVGGPVVKGTSLRTAKGVRAQLALQDGSKLTINEGSEVALQGVRTLALRGGELMARVAPDKGNPLRITTPGGVIRVTGTRLNVRLDGENTIVDVAKGTIEVGAEGRKVEVGAGERAVLRAGQPPRVGLSRDLLGATGWASEVDRPTRRDVNQLQPGFGSLTARVPGRGKSEALQLSRHEVRVVVRDNIARTEIEQHFYNPSNRTLEGTYRFPLPAGASISRLALYVGNRLEEGEIVERRRANRIFNQIVNDTIRPRDPALLEWVGGSTFRMKIFPIPPRAARRVILAYTQVLEGQHGRLTYVYPMASDPGRATRVGRFALDLKVHGGGVSAPLYPVLKEKTADGAQRLRFESSDFSPAASFVAQIQPSGPAPEMQVALHAPRSPRESKLSPKTAKVRGGLASSWAGLGGARRRKALARPITGVQKPAAGFFMARLRPELPASGRAQRRDYLFLLDSSHSIGPQGWTAEAAAVQAFLAEMDLRSNFALLACDSHCKQVAGGFHKPNAAGRLRAKTFLAGIKPGGASNLQGAFAAAAELAGQAKQPVTVVYLGDGRPSMGELREAELARHVVRALRARNASLTVLSVGEDVGAIFLGEATRKLGGVIHRLGKGDDYLRQTVVEVVASQYRPALTDLRISFEDLPGVRQVYPRELPTLSAGAEVVLVGRYEGTGRGAIRVDGRVDGRPFTRRYPLDLSAEQSARRTNAFIPRLWAQHHIEALTIDDYAKHRGEIVTVSQAFSVLSRATAFLVLENERMYREFGVKRKRNRTYWKGEAAKTDTLKDKADPAKAATATPTPKPALEESKLGKLGSTGSGAGGGALRGRGQSASDRAAKPSPRPAAPRAAAQAAAPSPAPSADSLAPAEREQKRRGPKAAPKSEDALDDLVAGGQGKAGGDDKSAEKTANKTVKKKKGVASKGDGFARPATKATTTRKPMRIARRSRPRPKKKPGSYYNLDGTVGGGRRARSQARVVVERKTKIESVDGLPRVSARRSRWQRRLADQVQAKPLLRSTRVRLHRVLMQNGTYAQALSHATAWAALDGDHVGALEALGDAQAAVGNVPAALRSYGSAIEVRPESTRLHRSLALAYRNKGDLPASCAHLWSVMSLAPQRLERHFALARCLVQVPALAPQASEVLRELAASPSGRRHAARIGKELVLLGSAKVTKRRAHGAIVLKASWNQPIDLDVALVTPRGDRISALRATRLGKVVVDSRDGALAEELALRWAGDGRYRVEIASADGKADKLPVSGTILVRAWGKTRTIPFTLSAAGARVVASISLKTHRRTEYGYY